MIPFSMGHADILRHHQGLLKDTAIYCERFPCRNPDAGGFDAQITEMSPNWQRCQRRHHRMRIQHLGGICPELLLARSCYLNLSNLSGTWCLGLLAKSTQTICLNWLLGQVGFNYYTTRQFRHFKPLLCLSRVCPDLPSSSTSLSIEDCTLPLPVPAQERVCGICPPPHVWPTFRPAPRLTSLQRLCQFGRIVQLSVHGSGQAADVSTPRRPQRLTENLQAYDGFDFLSA